MNLLKPRLAMTPESAAVLARRMIAIAELSRRETAGVVDVAGGLPNLNGPRLREHPDADWGTAAVVIDRAVHHLAESLPSGQLLRTRASLAALELGVAMLLRSLEARGVAPLQISVDERDAEDVRLF